MAEIMVTTEHFGRTQHRLLALATEFGVPIDFVASDQLRNLVGDLMRFSPPRKGPISGKSQSIDPKIGYERVRKDMGQLFVPVSASEFIKARSMGTSFPGYWIVQSETGSKWLVHGNRLHGKANIERVHDRNRERNGRVDADKVKRQTVGRIGPWTTLDKDHVRNQELKAAVKKEGKRVLKLASGWIPAWDGLSRKTKVRGTLKGVKISAIRKAAGGQNGNLSGHVAGIKGGTMAATNNEGYASQKYMSLLPSLISKRERDIRTQLPKRMENVVRRFNKA